MKTTPSTTSPAPVDPLVWCTVLIAKTRIGAVLKGRGAQVRLPLTQARTLEALERVRIDGI